MFHWCLYALSGGGYAEFDVTSESLPVRLHKKAPEKEARLKPELMLEQAFMTFQRAKIPLLNRMLEELSSVFEAHNKHYKKKAQKRRKKKTAQE